MGAGIITEKKAYQVIAGFWVLFMIMIYNITEDRFLTLIRGQRRHVSVDLTLNSTRVGSYGMVYCDLL